MLKVLTYATDLNHGNLRHLQSAIAAKVLPVLLPWTMDFYPKSYSVNEYLKNGSLDGEDLVLVCDAYDVLCINFCSIDLLEEKIRFYFDLDKITFNAEVNCYPDGSLAQLYPAVDGKWKYLNGGIYVGKVKNILSMLDILMPKIKNSDEQLQFSKFFFEEDLINLDYECKVFQTLYHSFVGSEINWSDFEIKDNLVYNKYFKTLPLLFHGNGKVNMSSLIQFSITK